MSSDSSSVPTEFVADAFETTVTEDEADALIGTINDAVSNLRNQIDDDTLEKILRADAGSYQLRSGMTKDGLQPESFTQDAIINPLLDALGHDYSTEAGGLSGGQTQVADYTVSQKIKADAPRLDLGEEADNRGHNPRYDCTPTPSQ